MFVYMVWAEQGPPTRRRETIVFFSLQRAEAEKALFMAQIAEARHLRAYTVFAIQFGITEAELDAWEDFVPGDENLPDT